MLTASLRLSAAGSSRNCSIERRNRTVGALIKVRTPRHGRCILSKPSCNYLLFLRENSRGGGDIPLLNAAKPTHGQIIALSRNGDGAVGTTAAFVCLALSDDFGIKNVGIRLPDARELPDTIEFRIFRLGP